MTKKPRLSPPPSIVLSNEHLVSLFDLLTPELVFLILDRLETTKPFAAVSRAFHSLESLHRRHLRPLPPLHLFPSLLSRYPNLWSLDLSLCPRVPDSSLSLIASSPSAASLARLDLSRSRFFTDKGLMQMAVNCRNLRELDLSNGVELRDSAMAAVAEARGLEKLWLGRCKMVTDIGIGCVAVGCRKLRLLSLRWCLGVGDLGVGLIAVKCQELRSLDLSYLPITNQCLPAILKLQHLEYLVLEGCFAIDDDSLAVLKHGSKSLKTLDMSSCQNVSHVGLSSITTGAGCLQQLVLSYGSPVTHALANSLQGLSKLQAVKLDGCLVTCDGLKAIGNWCESLRELSLSKCAGVTDEGLSCVVTKHKELQKLDITCCRKITDLAVAHITASCTSLVSLRMESCTLIPREAFILIGKRCHQLQELDLTDNEVDNEGLKSISRCTKLTSLKLGICLNISDEGLTHVGNHCSKLVELDLYRSIRITDLGILAVAAGCPGLEIVNMSYCKDITDGSLFAVSKCSKLNTLECRGCPLVTCLGVAAVAVGCKQLNKLDIKKCHNINDYGMIPLAHFSQHLRQINLSYCSVTDVGLLSLASISCLQSMTILHLKGLTPSGLAAALLACGGLTKVKLHASFKSALPQQFLEHLEARGYVFQWRYKEYQQDEMDSKSWKMQLDDMEL
ncbi:F-box/LRR-repeat protein 3-like protein [Drosera capensis]